MSRTLKVFLGNANPKLVHEFRNFGEEVFRTFRDEFFVSIHEIDQSTDSFYLRDIPARQVGTVTKRVRKLVESHAKLNVQIEDVTV